MADEKPIEGVGTGIVDLGPEGPDIPVVVVVVAAVVSAIGSAIGVLLARTAKRREVVVQLPGVNGDNKIGG